jgi:uncharacterized protein YciI
MFIVLLRFSANSDQAGQFMDGHNEWIRQGFTDDVLLMAGSLKPGPGGAVLAHNTTLAELEERVGQDPFVAEDVVTAEIVEIEPAKVDDRLAFLLA